MLPLHYTAYLYIYIYATLTVKIVFWIPFCIDKFLYKNLNNKTMNIYNKLGASHKKSITHEGKKPKNIVGTIKEIIKTVSL